MFRENVLIALTIVITILALSFIILLTVFLQIHEMEERLKRFEKRQQDLLETNFSSAPIPIDKGEDDDALPLPMPMPKAREDWYKRNEMIFGFAGAEGVASKPPIANDPLQTTTTTTPEPIPTYFGISDDKDHPEPDETVRFPFHFFGSSGHLTIEIPESDNFTDYENEKIIKEVLKRLRIYYEHRRIQELNSRMRYFNGLPGEPLGYFYPFNMKHSKYIWFEKSALQSIAPEAIITHLPRQTSPLSVGNNGKRRRRRRKRTIPWDEDQARWNTRNLM